MANAAPAILDVLRRARIVPVIRMHERAHAETAAHWLIEAGFHALEITLTVPGAAGLIHELAAEPDVLVGAGTVPSVEDAEACLTAGARFIVAPWVDPALAEPVREHDALLMLGALTPSEVRAASRIADVVKIFPASSAGGPAHLRALVSVFPEVLLCPTGGIAPAEVGSYLAAGAAFVGIGGALANERTIAQGDRAAVLAAARVCRGA